MIVWVLIPAYQAAASLPGVLSRLAATRLPAGAVTVVLDDGSTDGTAAVARAEGVRVVSHPRNLGYARAQKTLFRLALSEGAGAVVLLHADGQYPPEALPRVLAPILDGEADVVLGTRVRDGGARRRGMPFSRWAANRALSHLENLCFGLTVSEYHSGMMAYSRRALEALPWAHVSDTFHIDGELTMLSGRRGLRLAEVDIEHVYAGERSHLRPLPYVLTVMAIAIGVRVGLYDAWVERRARAAGKFG